MKRLGILFFAMVLVSTISFAQNRGGQRNFDPKERAKQTTADLKDKLGLNSDQEKKVYDLNLKNNEKMMEMRKEMQGSGGGFEGMREKMGAVREEYNKEMKKILTDKQWEKYEKYMEERRSRRGQGGRPGGNR